MQQHDNHPATQPFPGGDDHPSYSLAYTVWLVLFLGVICIGMLNFLGIFFKR